MKRAEEYNAEMARIDEHLRETGMASSSGAPPDRQDHGERDAEPTQHLMELGAATTSDAKPDRQDH